MDSRTLSQNGEWGGQKALPTLPLSLPINTLLQLPEESGRPSNDISEFLLSLFIIPWLCSFVFVLFRFFFPSKVRLLLEEF